MKRSMPVIWAVGLVAILAGLGCESTQMREQPSVRWQSAPTLQRDPWNVPFSGREASYARTKGKELSNPLPASEETIELGRRVYERNCDFCHGLSGKGDGPVAKKLFPVPKDLTSERVQRLSDGDIFLAITRGEGTMPSFRTDLTVEERWALVHYIRAVLARKASAAD